MAKIIAFVRQIDEPKIVPTMEWFNKHSTLFTFSGQPFKNLTVRVSRDSLLLTWHGDSLYIGSINKICFLFDDGSTKYFETPLDHFSLERDPDTGMPIKNFGELYKFLQDYIAAGGEYIAFTPLFDETLDI